MTIIDPESHPLFGRIDRLRLHSLGDKSGLRRRELSLAIQNLDKVLKRDLRKAYGNENFRKRVPEWHKLVGSTPETHDLPDEARQAVVRKVECLVQAFENKWDL